MAKRKYSRSSNKMVDGVGDASLVNEEMWGWTLDGAKSLQYPGISSCTTVTIHLSNGKTMGAHLPYTATEAEADAIFADMEAYRFGKGNPAISGIDVVGKIEIAVPDTSWLGIHSKYQPAGNELYKQLNNAFSRREGEKVNYYNQTKPDMDYQVLEGSTKKIWQQREHKAQGQQNENPWEETMNFELFEE